MTTHDILFTAETAVGVSLDIGIAFGGVVVTTGTRRASVDSRAEMGDTTHHVG